MRVRMIRAGECGPTRGRAANGAGWCAGQAGEGVAACAAVFPLILPPLGGGLGGVGRELGTGDGWRAGGCGARLCAEADAEGFILHSALEPALSTRRGELEVPGLILALLCVAIFFDCLHVLQAPGFSFVRTDCCVVLSDILGVKVLCLLVFNSLMDAKKLISSHNLYVRPFPQSFNAETRNTAF
jgi:hypothetical protein